MRTKKAPGPGAAAAMAAALSNGALPGRAGHDGKGGSRSREIWWAEGKGPAPGMAGEGKGRGWGSSGSFSALGLPHGPSGSVIAPRAREEATRRVPAGYGPCGGVKEPLVPLRALTAQPGFGEGTVPPQSHGKGLRGSDPSVIHGGGLGKRFWKATHTQKKKNNWGMAPCKI